MSEHLVGEVARLKELLQQAQAENRAFRLEMYTDPVIGEIIRLRSEIEMRKSIERELLRDIEEADREHPEFVVQSATNGLRFDNRESDCPASVGNFTS
jgi:hypothetical protein